MRINNNLMAMNAQRYLGVNNSNIQKSIEKLSSGYRINRAGDDAAGLAISEKMRAQIRGLKMASKNSQDAISLIQTAEGALNETHAILQRMRELAVQAATDTNESVDREALQNEMDELIDELRRIAETTQFNEKTLLDGSLDNKPRVTGDYSNTAVTSLKFADGVDGFTGTISISHAYTAETEDDDGSFTVTFEYGGTPENLVFTIAKGTGAITAPDGFTLTDGVYRGQVEINNVMFDVVIAQDRLVDDYKDETATVNTEAAKGLTFQIGANQNQSITFGISDMSHDGLGVNGLKIDTRDDANTAISTIDSAIGKVSSERSKLGAYQNRLEHTINNLNTSAENLTAAESRIRDVDMANEMMEYTKNNILAQAATAMLAQANQAPQSVLQLLR
jgi:flagellin